MVTPNYIYPLPPEKLHDRYDRVFDFLKEGQSVTLIGLPESSRSAYFKFIMQNGDFLKEFTNPESHKFVYLENKDSNIGNMIQTLVLRIASSGILSSEEEKEILSNPNISDPLIATHLICNMLEKVKDKKLTIVIYEAEEVLPENPEFISSLFKIWCTKRLQPDNLVTLVFISSPQIENVKLSSALSPLRTAFEEKTLFFPLFDQEEMTYHKKRLENFSQSKITDAKDRLIKIIADGHAVAYKILFNIPEDELTKMSAENDFFTLQSLSEKIWSGMTEDIRKNYFQDKKFEILNNMRFYDFQGKPRLKFLPPAQYKTEKLSGMTLPRLTAQQRLVFDFLLKKKNEVVSRDEVSEIIWGKQANEKYSDWAIDQAMHKLRKKLHKANFDILTLRNRGYQLVDII